METVKLSSVCNINYGRDYKKLEKGNIPVYGSGGVVTYVDEFLYDKPSVLIPRKGTLNNIFYLESKFWTIDTLFWTEINTDIIEPRFLYYYLKTINFNDLNIGSAVLV